MTDAVQLSRTLPAVSMNGHYLRVTPDELVRALKDPEWALELAEDAWDVEEDADLPPGEARYLSTHKAWQAIGFILEAVEQSAEQRAAAELVRTGACRGPARTGCSSN